MAKVDVAVSSALSPDKAWALASDLRRFDEWLTIFAGGAVTAGLAMVLIAFSRPRRTTIESVEARYESRAMNHEWG